MRGDGRAAAGQCHGYGRNFFDVIRRTAFVVPCGFPQGPRGCVLDQLFAVDVELDQFLVEGATADPQGLCHGIHSSTMGDEGLADDLSLESCHRLAQCIGDVAGVLCRRESLSHRPETAPGGQDPTFGDIAQLTDVARPLMRQQCCQVIIGQLRRMIS